MSPRTTVPIIHCTDYTHTAATNQTDFIILGRMVGGWVLSAFITLLEIETSLSHSVFPEFKSSLSCFTCVLILAWFTSSCLISACPVAYSLSRLGFTLFLAVSDCVCPSPGLSSVCGFPVHLALRIKFAVDQPTPVLALLLCLVCATPVCWCSTLPVFWPCLSIKLCVWIHTSLVSVAPLQL